MMMPNEIDAGKLAISVVIVVVMVAMVVLLMTQHHHTAADQFVNYRTCTRETA